MKEKIVKLWKRIPKKYIIALAIFAAFYFFLSENNFMVIRRLQHDVNDLNKEAALLEEGIIADSIEAVNLFGSKEALEAYGREHYYMKRANEDIFIVNDQYAKDEMR